MGNEEGGRSDSATFGLGRLKKKSMLGVMWNGWGKLKSRIRLLETWGEEKERQERKERINGTNIEVRSEEASKINVIILKFCLELTMNITLLTWFLSKICKGTNIFFS